MKKILLLAILFYSCGPTHDLRKAQRLLDRAKAKGAKVTADTIYRDRTLTIKGDSTTIIQPVHHYHDTTITLFQDRIKVVQRWKHDTLIQKIDCPDTVIKWRERTAVVEKIECKDRFWPGFIVGCLALVLLVAVVWRVTR